MEEPEIIPPNRKPVIQRGWVLAYLEFLRSPHENRVLKMMPLALIGVIPLSILDDVLLPGLGLIDNVPTWLLTVGVLTVTAYKANRYR